MITAYFVEYEVKCSSDPGYSLRGSGKVTYDMSSYEDILDFKENRVSYTMKEDPFKPSDRAEDYYCQILLIQPLKA